MPELPEVETVRRELEPLIRGRLIEDFRVERGSSRLLRSASAASVRRRLAGRRFAAVARRGKYLGLRLDDESHCVVHLRMTGSLRFRPAGSPPDPFCRAVFSLDRGDELRFTDVRKFGTIDAVAEFADALPELGPEPFDEEFTPGALWSALRGRTAPLKSILLDQRTVAGIGNIYADEALFLARLHPEVPAGALRPAERPALHAAIVQSLREGVEHGGASFRDYTDVHGEEGAQQHYVRVFRRTGEPCDACGAEIRRTVVGGRATHWCPRCQSPRQRTRQVRSTRPPRR